MKIDKADERIEDNEPLRRSRISPSVGARELGAAALLPVPAFTEYDRKFLADLILAAAPELKWRDETVEPDGEVY